MAQVSKNIRNASVFHSPLPLSAGLWLDVVTAMGISSQQAKIVEFVLRDFSNKEIVAATGLSEGTVKDYLKRVSQRTGTRGRMQLAMHVFALALQLSTNGDSKKNR